MHEDAGAGHPLTEVGLPEHAQSASVCDRHIAECHAGESQPHEHQYVMHPTGLDDMCPHPWDRRGAVCRVVEREVYDPTYRSWLECDVHGYICAVVSCA